MAGLVPAIPMLRSTALILTEITGTRLVMTGRWVCGLLWSDLLKPISRFPLILNGQAYS
jgi:hypothetical protein